MVLRLFLHHHRHVSIEQACLGLCAFWKLCLIHKVERMAALGLLLTCYMCLTCHIEFVYIYSYMPYCASCALWYWMFLYTFMLHDGWPSSPLPLWLNIPLRRVEAVAPSTAPQIELWELMYRSALVVSYAHLIVLRWWLCLPCVYSHPLVQAILGLRMPSVGVRRVHCSFHACVMRRCRPHGRETHVAAKAMDGDAERPPLEWAVKGSMHRAQAEGGPPAWAGSFPQHHSDAVP